MRIQSAGRLGNNLFIWAYALGESNKLGKAVSIFSDKFHSNLENEEEETFRLLESDFVRFTRSNTLGAVLKTVDWLRRYSNTMYRIATFLFRIGSESEGNTRTRIILRGYFQNSKYVEANALEIASRLNEAIRKVQANSTTITEIKGNYEEYQAIHVRLGDFIGTTNGTISPSTYKKFLRNDLPIIVCTDGEKVDVEKYLDFKVQHIVTATETTAWETLAIFSTAALFVGVNSTLSWWGAFLASRNGSTAFLPEKWSTNASEDLENRLEIRGVNQYKNEFL